MSRLVLFNTGIPTPPAQGSGQTIIFAKETGQGGAAIYSIDETGDVQGPFGGVGAEYRWSVVVPISGQQLLNAPAQAVSPTEDPPINVAAPQPSSIGYPVSDENAESIVGFAVKTIYPNNDPTTFTIYVNGNPTGVFVTVPANSTAVVKTTLTAPVTYGDLVNIVPSGGQYYSYGYASITFSNVPVPA